MSAGCRSRSTLTNRGAEPYTLTCELVDAPVGFLGDSVLQDVAEIRARRRRRRAGTVNRGRENQRCHLSQYGFAPDFVVDIGVCRGHHGSMKRSRLSRFFLIDPLSESRELVAAMAPDIQYDFLELGVSDESGTLSLDVPKSKSGLEMSGFHSRSDRLARRLGELEQRTVAVDTLDNITRDRPGRIGLKIDTEGHETGRSARGRRNLEAVRIRHS